MSAVLDAVNPLERVRLSGELGRKVKELAQVDSALARVGIAGRIAAILRELGAAIAPEAEPKKIRNFGWDSVKLADLSMDDLRTLRERVEAEHANPRDESGRYLESGKPSLYLYDKKGRWKLDQLGWAVTYKLQAASKASAEGVAAPVGVEPDTSQVKTNEHGQDYVDMTVPTVLYRSVSPQEWAQIQAGGAVVGGLNKFNPFDKRREVFFGDALTTRLIWQGEDVSRRAEYMTQGGPLQQEYDALLADQKALQAKRPERYAALGFTEETMPSHLKYSDKVLKKIDDDIQSLNAKKDAVQERARAQIRQQITDLRAEDEARGYSSVVLETKPLLGGRIYSGKHSGMGDESEYGFDSGFVKLSDITRVRYVADRAVIREEGPQPQPNSQEEPEHVIVEHVTKGGKGKIIRGIVRTDLTYAEAKAIDEYTFKKDGGWFIREKHLEGFIEPDKGSRPPASAKVENTPEELAQAEADKLADAQLKEDKRRQEVGAKLRAAGASVVEKAEEELGRDRNTNTARRASMASSITQRHEAARATGLTMQNLATAIETGEAKHLSGITSRAAVESLQETLRSAMYEAEKGLSYSDQQRQKGRPPTVDDVKYAKYPMPMWGTAGTSLSGVLEAIKGKRGAPALAEKMRYSPGPDAEMIAALKAMIGPKETSYQVGWWNLEQVAKVARLKRAGITNTQELQDALTEYLQFREGARAEDPIKKAERALIGQKVGIDFFPTPAATAVRMAALAHIKKGDRVLEPSAGNGNLADAAKAAGAEVDVIEISSALRDILTAKGYSVVAHDFDSFEPEGKYDAILMNPPFSSRQDAAHIMRAYRFLKSGGHLVAIAGEGVFFGSDAKAQQFRDWLDSVGAEVESLDQNTFKDKSLLATTGANARLITIQK